MNLLKYTLIVFIFLFSSKLIGQMSKKEKFEKIISNNCPKYSYILETYSENTINNLVSEDSLDLYLLNLPTIIHEGFHRFLLINRLRSNNQVIYNLGGDSLIFMTNWFKSFPCKYIEDSLHPKTNYIPKNIYDVYINSADTNHITQKFGFIGLLDEFCANYIDLDVNLSIGKYLIKNSEKFSSKLFVEYLVQISYKRTIILQFELFISWYLDVAKNSFPKVFDLIINNKELVRLLNYIIEENETFQIEYNCIKNFVRNNFLDIQINGSWLIFEGEQYDLNDVAFTELDKKVKITIK